MARRYLIRARAKINLGLTVIGRRPDGYHEIESIMQQISLHDTLLLEPVSGLGLDFNCSDPTLAGSENLVYRAASILKEQAGNCLPGVKISLYKNIPVEAGLAGGSSDAAAALLGLNKFWNLGLSKLKLLELASQLGSDVPFCLQGGTALARGRGEELKQLPSLPFTWVILALPPKVKILTAASYRSFDRSMIGKPELESLIEAVRSGSKRDILSWLSGDFTNILETADLPGSELVGNLKIKLQEYGLQPVFSGSGPTLFMMTEEYSLARSAGKIAEELGATAYLCWTTGKNEEWFDV